MACNIEFDPIQTEHDGMGNVTSVTINGTAEDCPSVRVTFEVGVDFSVTDIVPVVDGEWDITFNQLADEVKCNVSFQGMAICLGDTDDELCRNSFGGNVPCIPEFECPNLDQIVFVVADECNEDGTRRVDFTCRYFAPDNFQVTINFGDGENELILNGAGFGDVEASHNYAPGEYEVSFQIDGCEIPPPAPVVIDVPACEDP